jgi:hypothetical protein
VSGWSVIQEPRWPFTDPCNLAAREPRAHLPAGSPGSKATAQGVETRRWTAHYKFVKMGVYANIAWTLDYNLTLARIQRVVPPSSTTEVPIFTISSRNERDSRGR